MGQTFSEPVTEKESSTEQNETYLVSSSSIQGWRISMEDAHTIMLTMPEDEGASFFAVFDGHGGAKVANYASQHLHKGLCSHPLYREGKIVEALKSLFVEFDEKMFNDENMSDELAGSTAVSVLIKDGQIYCANIGDSRAVASYGGKVDPLSIDHKPTNPTEMNRVISAGGWVQYNRVNGNLALSRAFGDFVFKRNEKRSAIEQIVIAYPDVQTRTLSDDLEFIVMACDGVWDVMTNEEVVEFIRRRIVYRMEPVAICEELITRCLAPDCQMGSGIGCDNMTVILICYLNGTSYQSFCDRVASVNPLLETHQRSREQSCGGDAGMDGDIDDQQHSHSNHNGQNNKNNSTIVTPPPEATPMSVEISDTEVNLNNTNDDCVDEYSSDSSSSVSSLDDAQAASMFNKVASIARTYGDSYRSSLNHHITVCCQSPNNANGSSAVKPTNITSPTMIDPIIPASIITNKSSPSLSLSSSLSQSNPNSTVVIDAGAPTIINIGSGSLHGGSHGVYGKPGEIGTGATAVTGNTATPTSSVIPTQVTITADADAIVSSPPEVSNVKSSSTETSIN